MTPFYSRLAAVAIALITVFAAGCVDGKLTPAGAALVKLVDVAACAVLEAKLPADPAKVVGDVCEADKPLLDLLLGAITAKPLTLRATLKPVARPPVRCGARTIGHLDASIAAEVQAQLDARAECR